MFLNVHILLSYREASGIPGPISRAEILKENSKHISRKCSLSTSHPDSNHFTTSFPIALVYATTSSHLHYLKPPSCLVALPWHSPTLLHLHYPDHTCHPMSANSQSSSQSDPFYKSDHVTAQTPPMIPRLTQGKSQSSYHGFQGPM